ncbi:hypothetical protein Ciccas_012667 [Cichlidogyrus casuarinus]|uniref:WD repeat-containing protein 89 n=1 Tax=Cichlidogyrus casuarinus TaxID=1844966 RepID=A0ABD2PSS6_9PLAT
MRVSITEVYNHSEGITAAELVEKDTVLILCPEKFLIYDAESLSCLKTHEFLKGQDLQKFAISYKSELMIHLNSDRNIDITSTNDFKLLKTIEMESDIRDSINCLAVNFDGTLLAVATTKLTKAKKQKLVAEPEEEFDDADVKLLVYDLASYSLKFDLSDCHSDTINHVIFNPCNSNQLLSCSDDGLVSLNDLSSEIENEDDRLIETFSAEDTIYRCSFLFSTPNQTVPDAVAGFLSSKSVGVMVWPLSQVDWYATEIKPAGDPNQILDLRPMKDDTYLALGHNTETNTLSLGKCTLSTSQFQKIPVDIKSSIESAHFLSSDHHKLLIQTNDSVLVLSIEDEESDTYNIMHDPVNKKAGSKRKF